MKNKLMTRYKPQLKTYFFVTVCFTIIALIYNFYITNSKIESKEDNPVFYFTQFWSSGTQDDKLSDNFRDVLGILAYDVLTKKEIHKALVLLDKSVEENLKEAYILKQLCILKGMYAEHDASHYLEKIKKDANLNNKDAQFILAVYLQTQDILSKKETQAMMEQLALEGNHFALLFKIVQASRAGDKDAYYFWVNKGVLYQLPYALYTRAWNYKRGDADVAKNIDLAIKYFKQAIQQNDMLAYLALTTLYLEIFRGEENISTSKSNERNSKQYFLKQAFNYMRKAAQLGFAPSEFAFAAAILTNEHPFHQLNISIDEMQKEAFNYLKICYENNEFTPLSGKLLAKCYIEGLGTKKDILKGKMILIKLEYQRVILKKHSLPAF